jgi:hypothetical protein
MMFVPDADTDALDGGARGVSADTRAQKCDDERPPAPYGET